MIKHPGLLSVLISGADVNTAGAGAMTQCICRQACNLSLIPGTHMGEGREQTPVNYPVTLTHALQHTYTHARTPAHTHTYIHIHKYNLKKIQL